MTACAEDLGVSLSCMPEVLSRLNILSLKVIRWTRRWNWDGQPYIPFEEYPEQSVATTSVHDSSTIRQWWNDEKNSVQAFVNAAKCPEPPSVRSVFTPGIAEFALKTAALCNSRWLINPLQDFLYLDHKYYLENTQDERINVPGSVNEFNWTYRIPCTIEELKQNQALLNKINEIVKIHDNEKNGGNQ